MNTYEKLSHLTADKIKARLAIPQERFQAAAERVMDIFFRREKAEVLIPQDCRVDDLPLVPSCPQPIEGAVQPDYWSTGEYAERDFDFRTRKNIFKEPLNLYPEALPYDIVQAIRAADDYASLAESLADNYVQLVKKTIEEHVKSQSDAVKELEGLVAQVS